MELSLTVAKLDESYRGVSRSEGLTYYIEGALAGETVSVKEQKRQGREVFCSVDKVLSPSSVRTSPPCPYYHECGNCSLMHMEYAEQLRLKADAVNRVLGCASPPQCKGLYYPFKYRNKLTLAFSKSQNQLKIGFFKEGTKEVQDIKSCLVNGEIYAVAYQILQDYCRLFHNEIYDVETHAGALRYLSLRLVGGALCVTLVSAERRVKGLQWLYNAFKKKYQQSALYLNINTSKFSNIFGNEFYFVEGVKNLTANYLGAEIALKPKVFLQVNEKMASYVLKDAVQYIKGLGVSRVIDGYCGAGVTSLSFAKEGLFVKGIEIEEQSVSSARAMARRNRIDAEFLCADAAEILPQVLTDDSAVFLDPPRAGLAQAIEPILLSLPKHIVYMSCSLESLKTDIEQLLPFYQIQLVSAYDMFPQTSHVETLVCLTKKN